MRYRKFVKQDSESLSTSIFSPSPKAIKLWGPTKQNAVFQAPKMHFAVPLSIPQGYQIKGPRQAKSVENQFSGLVSEEECLHQ